MHVRLSVDLPKGYTIREFRLEDLPRLLEITDATFGPVSIDASMERLLGPFSPGGWRARKRAAIEEDCRAQPDGVYVAVDPRGDVAGYVTTRLNPATNVGWIPNLAVDPAHQRAGLGRALLVHALDRMRQAGMRVAKIETLEQNPVGQKLYPRLGFREAARQIHYAMRLDEDGGEESGLPSSES